MTRTVTITTQPVNEDERTHTFDVEAGDDEGVPWSNERFCAIVSLVAGANAEVEFPELGNHARAEDILGRDGPWGNHEKVTSITYNED